MRTQFTRKKACYPSSFSAYFFKLKLQQSVTGRRRRKNEKEQSLIKRAQVMMMIKNKEEKRQLRKCKKTDQEIN